MAADVADWTQAVNVTGGSVAISGIATVTISGTPTVSISGTPTVNVGNTPSVTISSGTVNATITGTPNINIQSQTVNLNVQQPQTKLADLSFPATGTTTQTTAAVPTGTHAIRLLNKSNFNLTVFRVAGHTTGVTYAPADANSLALVLEAFKAVVIIVDSVQDTTFDVIGNNGGGSAALVGVTAVLDVQAVWPQNSQLTPVFVAGEGFQTGGNPASLAALAQVPADYEATGNSAPAAGSQASVVLAASAGKTYHANFLTASLESSAGSVGAADVTLQDGASVIFDELLGVQALIGASDHFELVGTAFKGTAGNSMTFGFTGVQAGSNQRITIGAYLQ